MGREEIIERYPDNELMFLDRFDDAIIGVSEDLRVVYDKKRILEILEEREGMGETEALEFFEFNISGAYMGEKTPIYVEV